MPNTVLVNRRMIFWVELIMILSKCSGEAVQNTCDATDQRSQNSGESNRCDEQLQPKVLSNSVMEQPYLTLNNGHKIPALGLGTWQSKPNEVKLAVETAIDAGYRHIDCAMVYGNEQEVGEALKTRIGSVVTREELFVTSKLWNTQHDPRQVLPACQRSLNALGLEYLDLYLIHWPIAFANPNLNFENNFPREPDGKMAYVSVPLEDTWRAMEQLVDAGLVRSIGLSNFNSQQVDRIVAIARIKPVALQVECHLHFQQKKLAQHIAQHNIVLQAYSPLGTGMAALFEDPTIARVAAHHHKTPAQVMIKFQLQRGFVVLPKSVTPERIVSNLNVFDFTISDEHMELLLSLDQNSRQIVPKIDVNGEKVFRDSAHPDFPFHLEY